MKSPLPLLLLLSSTSSSPFSPKGSCEDFTEGACQLSENNIVGHDRHTDSPKACQTLCIEESLCTWFTHFSTQCYLLAQCGTSASCKGCTSGPTEPDIDTCTGPTPTTHEPKTTTTAKPITQTTTTSTTTVPTTTTNSKDGCENIHIDSQCDWNYGLITWYEKVMTGSECQYLCMNVNGAKVFSHYNEGRHAEKGFCGCFSTCAWPSSAYCHDLCSTHEVFSEEEEEDRQARQGEELGSEELFGGEVGVPPSPEPRP